MLTTSERFEVAVEAQEWDFLEISYFQDWMGDWVACPHCGEKIKRDATACRHCGSDDRTGWSEATYMDGIDTPEEGDYEEGLEREGFAKPGDTRKDKLVMGAVSTVLILLFLSWLLKAVL